MAFAVCLSIYKIIGLCVLTFFWGCDRRTEVDYSKRINTESTARTISVPKIGPYASDQNGCPPANWQASVFPRLAELGLGENFRLEVEIEVFEGKRPEQLMVEVTDSSIAGKGNQVVMDSETPKNDSQALSKVTYLLRAPQMPGLYHIHCREMKSRRQIFSSSFLVSETAR